MMRAIVLNQPYASLMALHAKTIETRNRLTHVRGDVAICAASKKTNELCEIWNQPVIRAVFASEKLNDFWTLPFGSVVAVVNIYDCKSSDEMMREHRDWVKAEEHFGVYGADRWCWLTSNLRAIEPVPVKGGRGFFFLPADVEQKVKAQFI